MLSACALCTTKCFEGPGVACVFVAVGGYTRWVCDVRLCVCLWRPVRVCVCDGSVAYCAWVYGVCICAVGLCCVAFVYVSVHRGSFGVWWCGTRGHVCGGHVCGGRVLIVCHVCESARYSVWERM